MNSVSVISRAYDAEAPYIKSFIDHYTSIGCKEFHIVVPKGNPYQYLKAVCDNFSQVRLYINYPENIALRGSQSIPLQNITTSHLISVDIDEYLDIPNINTLLEHDYIRLNWVIAPYSSVPSAKKIPGFIDKQCKYIIRTSLCEAMDDHDCKLKQPTTQFESEYKLIHYVYRSFNDLYLKCSMSNYGDYQAKNNDNLMLDLKDITNLPHKFKMATIYQRIANASQEKYPILYNIDIGLEEKLVRNTVHYEKIEKLHFALLHYSSRIDLKQLVRQLLKHKNYKLYGRIPHHVMAEISDKVLIDTLFPDKWVKESNVNYSYNFPYLSSIKIYISYFLKKVFS